MLDPELDPGAQEKRYCRQAGEIQIKSVVYLILYQHKYSGFDVSTTVM